MERIPDRLWDVAYEKIKPRESQSEFKRRLQGGDVWSFKNNQLKDILKCCRDHGISAPLSGNKSDLVARIKGIFATTSTVEPANQGTRVQLNIVRPTTLQPRQGYTPYPPPVRAPRSSVVKEEAVDHSLTTVTKFGRCLKREEALAFGKIQANIDLSGYQSPFNPAKKVIDVLSVSSSCVFEFELEAEDHQQVVQRVGGLRVHLMPLKHNLRPEAWLQAEHMHIYVNGNIIDGLPKNWRKKNARVDPFQTVLPMDVTPHIHRSSARCHIRLEFTGKEVFHGLFSVFLVASRTSAQLAADIIQRSALSESQAAPLTEDDDIQMGDESVSLRCPISLMRIRTPAKGTQCIHKAAFDLEYYMQFCNQQRIWNCPICEQQCSFSMLRVDALISKVLESVKDENVTHVCIHPDNRWEITPPTQPNGHSSSSSGSEPAKAAPRKEIETVSLDSDDEDEDEGGQGGDEGPTNQTTNQAPTCDFNTSSSTSAPNCPQLYKPSAPHSAPVPPAEMPSYNPPFRQLHNPYHPHNPPPPAPNPGLYSSYRPAPAAPIPPSSSSTTPPHYAASPYSSEHPYGNAARPPQVPYGGVGLSLPQSRYGAHSSVAPTAQPLFPMGTGGHAEYGGGVVQPAPMQQPLPQTNFYGAPGPLGDTTNGHHQPLQMAPAVPTRSLHDPHAGATVDDAIAIDSDSD